MTMRKSSLESTFGGDIMNGRQESASMSQKELSNWAESDGCRQAVHRLRRMLSEKTKQQKSASRIARGSSEKICFSTSCGYCARSTKKGLWRVLFLPEKLLGVYNNAKKQNEIVLAELFPDKDGKNNGAPPAELVRFILKCAVLTSIFLRASKASLHEWMRDEGVLNDVQTLFSNPKLFPISTADNTHIAKVLGAMVECSSTNVVVERLLNHQWNSWKIRCPRRTSDTRTRETETLFRFCELVVNECIGHRRAGEINHLRSLASIESGNQAVGDENNNVFEIDNFGSDALRHESMDAELVVPRKPAMNNVETATENSLFGKREGPDRSRVDVSDPSVECEVVVFINGKPAFRHRVNEETNASNNVIATPMDQREKAIVAIALSSAQEVVSSKDAIEPILTNKSRREPSEGDKGNGDMRLNVKGTVVSDGSWQEDVVDDEANTLKEQQQGDHMPSASSTKPTDVQTKVLLHHDERQKLSEEWNKEDTADTTATAHEATVESTGEGAPDSEKKEMVSTPVFDNTTSEDVMESITAIAESTEPVSGQAENGVEEQENDATPVTSMEHAADSDRSSAGSTEPLAGKEKRALIVEEKEHTTTAPIIDNSKEKAMEPSMSNAASTDSSIGEHSSFSRKEQIGTSTNSAVVSEAQKELEYNISSLGLRQPSAEDALSSDKEKEQVSTRTVATPDTNAERLVEPRIVRDESMEPSTSLPDQSIVENDVVGAENDNEILFRASDEPSPDGKGLTDKNEAVAVEAERKKRKLRTEKLAARNLRPRRNHSVISEIDVMDPTWTHPSSLNEAITEQTKTAPLHDAVAAPNEVDNTTSLKSKHEGRRTTRVSGLAEASVSKARKKTDAAKSTSMSSKKKIVHNDSINDEPPTLSDQTRGAKEPPAGDAVADPSAVDSSTPSNKNRGVGKVVPSVPCVSGLAKTSSSKKKKKSDTPKKNFVPLFSFNDAPRARSKRMIMSVKKFDPSPAAREQEELQILKTGWGFACPSCGELCGYDEKKCLACGLLCQWVPGVGAVELKDRRSFGKPEDVSDDQPPKTGGEDATKDNQMRSLPPAPSAEEDVPKETSHREHDQTKEAGNDKSKECAAEPDEPVQEIVIIEKTMEDTDEAVVTKVARPNLVPAKPVSSRPSDTHVDSSPESKQPWTKLDWLGVVSEVSYKDPFQDVDFGTSTAAALAAVNESLEDLEKTNGSKPTNDDEEYALETKLYKRGVQSRRRLADSERREKANYQERCRLISLQLQYDNRAKKKSAAELEYEGLLERPVRFAAKPTAKPRCKFGPDCKICKSKVATEHELASERRDMLLPSVRLWTEATEENESSPRPIRCSRAAIKKRKATEALTTMSHTLRFIDSYNKGFLEHTAQLKKKQPKKKR